MNLPSMGIPVGTLHCFTDAQLAQRDAATAARTRAEVAEQIALNLDEIAGSTRESLVGTPPEYTSEAARHRWRAEAFERSAYVARAHAGNS